MTLQSKIREGQLPSYEELSDFINGQKIDPCVRIAIAEILNSNDRELKEILLDMVAGIQELETTYGNQAEDKLTAQIDEMYFPELEAPTTDLTTLENLPELFFDSPKLKANYLDGIFLQEPQSAATESTQKVLMAKIDSLTDALEKMQNAFNQQTEKMNTLLAQKNK